MCVALIPCANVFAGDDDWETARKEAFDATRYQPDLPDVVAPTDLDFDAAFGSGGTAVYDFNAAGITRDWGMRTFDRTELIGSVGGIPVFGTFRYVVGVHWHNGTWDAAVARTDPATGAFETSSIFASGRITVPTTLVEAQDVAFDGDHRLYFTGQSDLVLFGKAFATYCLDIDTGTACTGFASGSVTGYNYTIFDVPGGTPNSIARRVVYDPTGYLFVGGESNMLIGKQLALTKINATTGQNVTSFGVNGNVTYQVLASIDQNVAAMVRRAPDGPGLDLLYVGGAFQRSTSDYDGYISAINPASGAIQSTVAAFYEDDNTGFKKDSVNAISVLANGKLAFVGSSDTDHVGVPSLLLGRINSLAAGLSYDTSFCGSGRCAWSNFGLLGSFANAAPIAIAERPGNRDLVISMQGNSFAIGTPQVIRVEQYSANGTMYRIGKEISVQGNGTNTTWAGPGLEVDDKYVTVTGTRLWGPTIKDDVDFVVARLQANDSIFADRFGGPHGD
jgi:hypothetical protein